MARRITLVLFMDTCARRVCSQNSLGLCDVDEYDHLEVIIIADCFLIIIAKLPLQVTGVNDNLNLAYQVGQRFDSVRKRSNVNFIFHSQYYASRLL